VNGLLHIEKKRGRFLTSPVSGFSLFTAKSELRDQILPCRMNEITSEYRVSDSTNASPMIIETKSWAVLLGLPPIVQVTSSLRSPLPTAVKRLLLRVHHRVCVVGSKKASKFI
jgi:hypothetical protein